jgi:acyl carrier protein
MVPTTYVRLDEFPLTPNGKLDRDALPTPDVAGTDSENPYAAPRNSTEEILADIWADVLKIDRVGVHDNFFDLGGHSLLATQILSRIRKTFQAKIALRDFFASPSIAELACLVEAPNSNPSLQTLSGRSED